MDLDSKQTISPRASCSLPPYPPLPDCYTGHPLPSVLIPLCPPRWQGGMVERPRRPRHQDLSSPSIRLSLCSRLAMCAGMYPQASRGVSVAATDAPLGCQSHSLCVPLPLIARSPTLLLAHTEAASGLPSTASLHPACCSPSLPVASASFSGSSVLPGATWPGVPLSHQATWVTSVNVLRPSLLLPGALSCSPVHHLCSQSPSPSLWRLVPSTPLDLTGTVAPLLISSHCTSQHKVFCREAAVVPPPFFLCPVSRFFQTVWCSVCKSVILRIAFVNIFVNILVLSLIIFNIFMTWL